MPLFIGFIVMFSILTIFAGIYLTLGPDGQLEDRLVVSHNPAEKSSNSAIKQRVNAQLVKGRWGAGLNVALFQAGVKLTAVDQRGIDYFSLPSWLDDRAQYPQWAWIGCNHGYRSLALA